MQCAKCDLSDPPVDPVKCATCSQRFHAACTRLESIDKWTKMNLERRECWKCDLCRHIPDPARTQLSELKPDTPVPL
ncbi:unnamed protein product, partial [Nesidiocoris tenuis]